MITREVVKPTPVPADLRQPAPKPDLRAKDATDVGVIIVRYDESLTTCNGRIVAIDDILTAAEEEAGILPFSAIDDILTAAETGEPIPLASDCQAISGAR